MMKRWLAAALALGAPGATFAQQAAKRDPKQAGQDTKQAGKDAAAANDAGKATSKAAKGTVHRVKNDRNARCG